MSGSSTACLVEKSGIVALGELQAGHADFDALSGFLEKAGVSWGQVAAVATCAGPHRIDGSSLPSDVRRIDVTHHTALAYAATVHSTYNDGVIAVVGSSYGAGIEPVVTDSLHRLRDGRLEPIEESLGNPSTATLLGFHRTVSRYVLGRPDGSLAGAAASGRPDAFGGAAASAVRFADGRVIVDPSGLGHLDPERSAEHGTPDAGFHADVARWAQDLIEKAALDLLAHWYELCPATNLAYAGGLAFDAALNSRISTETPFDQVYVHAAPVAGSLAAGCGYYAWAEVLGEVVPPNYDYIPRFAAGSTACGRRSSAVADHVSAIDRLARGEVVEWAEPGADGDEVFALADPRSPRAAEAATWADHPQVLVSATCAAQCFEVADANPYGALAGVARSNPDWMHPGLLDAAGRVRLRVVSDASHPELHAMLTSWHDAIGVPALVAVPEPRADNGVRQQSPRRAPAPGVRRRGADCAVLTPVRIDRLEQCEELLSTVDSLRGQSDDSWHLLLVDDGSPLPEAADAFSAIVADLGDKATLIRRRKNAGQGICRNIAARWAWRNGIPYCLYLDGDDLADPRRVEVVRRNFRERREVDFQYSTFELIDERGHQVPEAGITPSIKEILQSHEQEPPTGARAWRQIATEHGYTTLTSATSVRTWLAVAHPFPDVYVSEDQHAWLRMTAATDFVFFDRETTAKYRIATDGGGSSVRKRIGDGYYEQKAWVDTQGVLAATRISVRRGRTAPAEVPAILADYYVRCAQTLEAEGRFAAMREYHELAGVVRGLDHDRALACAPARPRLFQPTGQN
ncbi:glycosyltransferase [Saccharopolyspora sp. NPDC050642]|uniref:glycosyltransferase n=1 Tax=Saccharopolyspora sp. NPDC050642 TaxID=3157099 RepID=UPI0033D4439A